MDRTKKTIPIFPLNGVLLLPGGNLPLNIFEPRYIDMIDYAFKNEKLIGMIQNKKNDSEDLFDIGCIGKISSYTETEDDRYVINLSGFSRFKILKEVKVDQKFRMCEVDFSEEKYFFEFDKTNFDKNSFIKKVNRFLSDNGMAADIESITKIDDKSLITMVAMICPFDVNEKQMLLESKNIDDLLNILISLIDFSNSNIYQNKSIN
jgi:Uncharacterized protein, similar to the N-terminal domain of Lon protease